MTDILAAFTPVLTFVLSSLTLVVNAVIANPVLLLFVAVGIAGMIFYWAKSFIHA